MRHLPKLLSLSNRCDEQLQFLHQFAALSNQPVGRDQCPEPMPERRAREVILARSQKFTDEEMLERLRGLLSQHGRISGIACSTDISSDDAHFS